MGTIESRASRRRIAGFDAHCTTLALRDGPLALWQVDTLERYIDRQALLAADSGPEPPYWALCWSGARVLAEVTVPPGARVVEAGCGLGLPGLAAARRGARVLLVDRIAAPLGFAMASAETNQLRGVAAAVGDLTSLPVRAEVDRLLAAEVLYDRASFAPFAHEIARVLAPGGEAWLSDARRIDTKAFYDVALPAAGLKWTSEEVRVDEEGWPITVAIVRVRRN